MLNLLLWTVVSDFFLKSNPPLKAMYDQVPKKDCEFSELPQADDSETLLSNPEDEGYSKFTRWAKGSRWSIFSRWTAQHYPLGIAFLLVSLFSCMTGMWIGSNRLLDADKFCTHHIAQPCELQSIKCFNSC